VRDVVILEQEPTPGAHASGRNAAMVRQAVLPESVFPLAVEGARFIRGVSGEHLLLRECGSLILARGADAEAARRSIPRARSAGLNADWLDEEAVVRRVPIVTGARFDGAVALADDGVVDVAALLALYLNGARAGGATLLPERRAESLRVRNGDVVGVETQRETIEARWTVNAAGAWAGQLGAGAGAPLPLRPCRRHLAVSHAVEGVAPGWPFVWDVSEGIYFRPEPPGLLLCACDEDEQPPGEAVADPGVLEMLAQKITRHLPRLAGVRVARYWAGLRTLTPDGAFAIGRDPRLGGLVWCAGLGGHGVTTSAAAGRLAAEAVLGRPAVAAHDPGRLL